MIPTKILLIGFQNYEKNMYPHLKVIIDSLSEKSNLKYIYFRERGYFLESFLNEPHKILSYWTILSAIINTVKDSIRLAKIRENYDFIIVTDEYIFSIASLLFKNTPVILWSHDIIYKDNKLYNTRLIKFIHNICARSLIKNHKIIIQDSDRLNLLLESLNIGDNQLDIFFLPVSLPQATIQYEHNLSSYSRPRVMQCGGIGGYRSSDKILTNYQKNYSDYRLIFHGFVFKDILSKINSYSIKPFVSTMTIDSSYIPQIIDNCDIGFIGYAQDESNFYYIKNASGQFVEFIRMGKPVIVMGHINLKSFVEMEKIGMGINNIDELTSAIKVIKSNYEDYSKNCIRCFNNNYNSNKYSQKLINWLSS